MLRVVSILLASLATWFRSRLAMQMELIALRHQVAVYKESISRPKLRPADRWLWVGLSRLWPGWQQALEFVQRQHRHRLAEEAISRLLATLESAEKAGASRDFQRRH